MCHQDRPLGGRPGVSLIRQVLCNSSEFVNHSEQPSTAEVQSSLQQEPAPLIRSSLLEKSPILATGLHLHLAQQSSTDRPAIDNRPDPASTSDPGSGT
jgi:hypothetical protein